MHTFIIILAFIVLIIGMKNPSLIIRNEGVKNRKLKILCALAIITSLLLYITPTTRKMTPEEREEFLKREELLQKAKAKKESSDNVQNHCEAAVITYLHKNLHDPSSYENVSFGNPVKEGKTYRITHRFRAKNKFGALILEEKTFQVDSASYLAIPLN